MKKLDVFTVRIDRIEKVSIRGREVHIECSGIIAERPLSTFERVVEEKRCTIIFPHAYSHCRPSMSLISQVINKEELLDYVSSKVSSNIPTGIRYITRTKDFINELQISITRGDLISALQFKLNEALKGKFIDVVGVPSKTFLGEDVLIVSRIVSKPFSRGGGSKWVRGYLEPVKNVIVKLSEKYSYDIESSVEGVIYAKYVLSRKREGVIHFVIFRLPLSVRNEAYKVTGMINNVITYPFYKALIYTSEGYSTMSYVRVLHRKGYVDRLYEVGSRAIETFKEQLKYYVLVNKRVDLNVVLNSPYVGELMLVNKLTKNRLKNLTWGELINLATNLASYKSGVFIKYIIDNLKTEFQEESVKLLV